MGKGKRNSLNRELDAAQNADKHLERQHNQNKKSKADKGVALACIIFALVIAVVLVFTVMSEAGVFIRMTDAVSGETVEVDAAMMSFFLNDSIMTFYNNYYSYLGYFSLDLSSDLRTQTYGTGNETLFLGEFDGTWYDYFLSSVMEDVELYVTYAEAAKAADLSLTEEDEEEIDELLDSIKETLKASNASYSDWYGRGVKKSDIRRCYELIYLASNFAEYKQEQLEKALDEDDAPLHTYIEENKSQFYTAEYLSYEISLSSKNYDNDAAYDEAVEAARAAADTIAEAKTPAEFVSFVEAYEAANGTETDAETETDSTESETLSPEEELESKIDDLKSEISYETDDELGKWIFEEGAKVNDVKVIEETDTETVEAETTEDESETADSTAETVTYNTYSVTVYLLSSESALDTSLTKNFGYVITDDKDALDALIAEFKAADMTADKLVEMAEDKYNSIHDSEDHEHSDEELFVYDSVERTGDELFNSSYAVLNDWLDSGNLEANTLSDVFEVVVEDVTYYAVIYFENYDAEAWYASAYDSTVSQQFEEWYTAELESKPLTVNDKAIADIGTIMFSTSTAE